METSARRTRYSTRLQKKEDDEGIEEKEDLKNILGDSDDDSQDEAAKFEFEGIKYRTYVEMVHAKRKRNEEYLKQNGLWNPMARLQQQNSIRKRGEHQNGLKKRKMNPAEKNAGKDRQPRRVSNRLRGTPADGRFVEHEGGGSFVIAAGRDGQNTTSSTTTTTSTNPANRARVNDGSPLSLEESINLCDPKWIEETSVESAKKFTKESLLAWNQTTPTISAAPTATTSRRSLTSVVNADAAAADADDDDGRLLASTIIDKLKDLSVDDDNQVAKVCPDRLYSVATHPSTTQLVIAAGDKNGYVGLWDVDKNSSNNNNGRDGVHLLRFHTRPVNALQWTSEGLLSSSYDSTVRYFDVAKECFEEVFSTNEREDDHFYTQYLSLDPRANKNEQAFFLSTSMGSVMHIDRRVSTGSNQKGGGRSVTFHAICSDEGKKINSVSLHRDGHCLATGGLDRTVKFWDIRKFGSKSSATEYKGAFLGEHNNSKSVNSAFFSPSGEYLVTTNMANSLNIYKNSHLQVSRSSSTSSRAEKKNPATAARPEHVIRHNNNTGRWLTTFMAQWHPEVDIFCVGSMEKPRGIDVYDGASGDHLRAMQGEALTAVASRCCFHPSTDKLILVGGNSSGRVTVIR